MMLAFRPMRTRFLKALMLGAWLSLGATGARAEEGDTVEARKVAVLPLVIEGSLDADARDDLMNRLRGGLERGEFTIAPQADVELRAESPCDRMTCYGKLRSELGVSHLVRATVVVKNRDYEMSVELIDAESGNVIATNKDRCDICGLGEVGEQLASQGALLRSKLDSLGAGPAILVLESRPSGALVTVDGELVGTTPLERPVIAGSHVVRVDLDGYIADEREMTFVAGVTETISVDLRRAAASSKMRKIGIASLVTGVVGIAAGTVLLVLDDYGQNSPDPYPEWKCVDPSKVDEQGDCERLYNFSPAGGIVAAGGAALTTLGVVLLLRHRKPKASKASATATVSPTGVWIQGRF